jgi:hypothetical protein
MKNMTFEEIQAKLNETLTMAEVKVGSKQGRLLECVYVQALRDVGIQIPAAVDMMLLSGRSVAGYKKQAQRVH